MSIKVRIDNLANELNDYASIADLIATAADLDGDASKQYAAAADILYNGLDDIVKKMRILEDHTSDTDPYRVWITTTKQGEKLWHFATYDQIDRIREILNEDDEDEDGEE